VAGSPPDVRNARSKLPTAPPNFSPRAHRPQQRLRRHPDVEAVRHPDVLAAAKPHPDGVVLRRDAVLELLLRQQSGLDDELQGGLDWTKLERVVAYAAPAICRLVGNGTPHHPTHQRAPHLHLSAAAVPLLRAPLGQPPLHHRHAPAAPRQGQRRQQAERAAAHHGVKRLVCFCCRGAAACATAATAAAAAKKGGGVRGDDGAALGVGLVLLLAERL
jgi:hypothetical protein